MTKIATRLGLIAACAALVFASCAKSTDPAANNDNPSPVSNTVEGTLPIPNTLGITAPAGSAFRAVEGLSGTITVSVGDTTVDIDLSQVTFDENYIYAPFTANVGFSGVCVISFVADIQYGDQSLQEAGSLMVVVDDDAPTNINDTDGDGVVSEGEGVQNLYIEIASSGYTATALPAFTGFSLADSETEVYYTDFSATVSNLDFPIVYLRVNGQYRLLEVNPVDGVAGISGETITLEAGLNEVQLFALNSVGFAESEVQTVNCEVEGVNSAETLLVTLTWDKPTSDMDLHTWYYSETAPTAASDTDWHNCWHSPYFPITGDLPGGSVSATVTVAGTPATISTNIASGYMRYLNPDSESELTAGDMLGMTVGMSLSGFWTMNEDLTEGTFTADSEFSIDSSSGSWDGTVTSGTLAFTVNPDDSINGTVSFTGVTDAGAAITFSATIANLPAPVSSGRKLDVDDVEGYGPEHFTLEDAPDGYYVVAVDCYDLDEDPAPVSVFVTGQLGTASESVGPLTFSSSDGEDYPIAGNPSWRRAFDIRVVDGKATFLEPNADLVPDSAEQDMMEGSLRNYTYPQTFASAPAKPAKPRK